MTYTVYIKVMKVRNDVIIAICDEELLGKKFRDEERNLDFEVKESFFKGSRIKLEESPSYLEKASIANLIGTRIIEEAVKKGFVNPSAIIKIAGIPHAQIIKMH